MDRRLLVWALVTTAGLWAVGCTMEKPSQSPTFQTYTIEQFLKTTSVGGGSFDADNTRLLVHSNATGIFNVYSIDLETGAMQQLTDSQDTTYSVAYLPEGHGFFFTRDDGGNELYKLYLQDENGEARRLTQGEKTRELFYGYAHDLRSFFTGNNSRDARFIDVYEWPLDTLEPTLFYKNEKGWNLSAISRDKRWIALQETHTEFDSDMYLVDRTHPGAPRLISETEGEVNHIPQTFTPDGSKLLYLTDKDSDFLYLMSYDLASGEKEVVYRPEKWDISGVDFSFDGTYRILSVNENAVPKHQILNLADGAEVVIPNRPEGRLTGLDFSRNESRLRFFVGNADEPSNLYVWTLGSDEPRRLTQNLNPEIDPANLVRPDRITMTARDGLEFYGYLYKPIQASSDRKAPALLWIHGGPGGQSQPGWNAELQFLVNHGYGVFDLNYRGSGGFGRTFSMADDQKHGHEPLNDCVDAKQWLIGHADWVQPDKIGILGGSYGGYMVMAALAFQPNAFAVGVDLFGVTNWERTLKSIPPWWASFKEALYRELGNPETQEQMLHDISPLFFANQITKPVIILQGANDPRVLKVESDEMVQNIRQAGGTAEYVVFDDEGHGFTKTANRIRGWNAILEFLNTYL